MRKLSIAALAFVFAGFTMAADTPATKPVPASAQAEQEGLPVGSQVQTSGKVTSMHSVAMVGVTDPHIIVKLQTDEGDTDIVDLGLASVLKENGIEAKEGKQVWVQGRVGKINDKFLIVAESLSESKLVAIARTAPLREESVKHAQARTDGKDTGAVTESKDGNKSSKAETVDAGQQVRTIEGTVIHTRHVKIQGEADEHVLAKIQTDNGVAVVDLGTCPAMPSTVNLTEGQPLAATGFVGQLNGKPIIVADSVGNLTTIQRPAGQVLPTSSQTQAPIK